MFKRIRNFIFGPPYRAVFKLPPHALWCDGDTVDEVVKNVADKARQLLCFEDYLSLRLIILDRKSNMHGELFYGINVNFDVPILVYMSAFRNVLMCYDLDHNLIGRNKLSGLADPDRE